ncbi:dihydrodipicolinate synthase family protein [Pigmentiphaga sp. H8]|uniref:dihydrodipicolinate synthase family protein n=1 Tax=unclassified Pigmentiphaga TaxID=2626614 RepID=UPI000F5B6F4B|nr:dihydrodipicolinate synthase family protein [Pigmentiphaga sp. H8]AZG10987.1 dihydrodipicolinate synthase family protein [Pigmentiphaga sp. H8]
MKGIIAYLLTPCDSEGRVDHAVLASHVERLIEEGVHGLAPLGSTGCLPYLTDEEREGVIRTVVRAAAGRVPVVAGVSSLTTASTVRHARYAEQAGASAIQVLPSTYWKLTEDEIFAYYRAVCEAVSLPVMAYNNPFTTGMDMPVGFIRRLADLPNITMIKEASPDETKIARIHEACGDRLSIYVGLNSMALRGFNDGAVGWCTCAPNLCAPFMLNFYRCVADGDRAGAESWFARQSELLDFLMAHGLPRVVVAGLQLLGVPGGYLRAPLAQLGPEPQRELLSIMMKMGIKP